MADIWWHLCEHQARPRPQAPACISALSRGRAEAGVGPLLSLPSLQGAELRRNRHPLQSPCASPSAVGPWFPCPWGALLWAQPHRRAGGGVPGLGPAWASYRLSVRADAWFISLLAMKFLISEK